MVYRESVRLRGHVTSDVQGSASEKLDITGAESLPSSSRNRRRTKGYSDYSSLFSVAAISLCAGCICCGLALFIFSFWTSSRLQRTPKIDRTALRMAQEAAEQDLSPVLRQPLRRSFDDTRARWKYQVQIRRLRNGQRCLQAFENSMPGVRWYNVLCRRSVFGCQDKRNNYSLSKGTSQHTKRR